MIESKFNSNTGIRCQRIRIINSTDDQPITILHKSKFKNIGSTEYKAEIAVGHTLLSKWLEMTCISHPRVCLKIYFEFYSDFVQ